MKKRSSKEKNTIIMVTLLALAVCAIFAGTTYAFLSAQLTGDQGLINTFVSADGIIDPGNIPAGESDDYNFNLKESKVKINDDHNAYVADPDGGYTKSNTYDAIVPGMSIYKDPMVSVNIKANMSAYVYVEILDRSNNFTYTVNNAWTLLKDSTNTPVVGAQGGSVYVYNSGSPVVGDSTYEIDKVYIINGNRIFAKDDLVTTGTNQLGTINIYAYVGQSSGFANAWEAYNHLFKNN